MTIIATTENFILTNVGATANDGTGDGLRDAFIKINSNFSNISDIGMQVGNIHAISSILINKDLQINGNTFIGTITATGPVSTAGTLSVALDSTLGGNIICDKNVSLTATSGYFTLGNNTQNQLTWNSDLTSDTLQLRSGSRANVAGDIITRSLTNTNFTTAGAILVTLDPYNNVNGGEFTIDVAPQALDGNIAAYTASMQLTPLNFSVTAPAINLGGEITVTGNLTITGAVNEYLTNTFVTTDSMLYVNQYATSDTKDIGLVGAYINAGEKHTGVIRDASDGVWKFFHNVVTEPDSIVDFSSATYSDIIVGNITTFGGAGVAGVLYANNATAATSTTSGGLRAAGGAGIAGSLFVGASINAAGVLYANNATAATSTTSGAARVTGGLGVSGDIFAGASINSTGVLYANNATAATSTTSGGLRATGGAGIAGSLFVGASINSTGVLYANNATAATSTTSGAARVTGGLGVSGDIFAGGTINSTGRIWANAATAATSTSTGGVVVAGGLGVAGNIFASNVLATVGTGYASVTGTGGTITQATSKTTAVTINKPSGNIILSNTALANGTNVSFTINNTTISSSDILLLNIASGATPGAYQMQVQGISTGSANVALYNVYGTSLSEAIVINFAVFKASNQ